MDVTTEMGDDGGVVMREATTDCEEVWEERNRLAVALRRIVAINQGDFAIWGFVNQPSVGATWGDVARLALADVFPEDPLGERPIYDCPDAYGVNRLAEERFTIEEEADRGED